VATYTITTWRQRLARRLRDETNARLNTGETIRSVGEPPKPYAAWRASPSLVSMLALLVPRVPVTTLEVICGNSPFIVLWSVEAVPVEAVTEYSSAFSRRMASSFIFRASARVKGSEMPYWACLRAAREASTFSWKMDVRLVFELGSPSRDACGSSPS
jgi:hypothetical protein